jgi:hypothetical protein
MSKMALVRAVERREIHAEDIAPLAIAVREGFEERHPFLLPSMLYLHHDRIVFGQEAEEAGRRGERRDRHAFAAPKQYLSTHDIKDLDEQLPKDIDPTGSYTRRAALELFLAHLLERAGHAARTARVPWPVPLRIARPAWDKHRAEAGEAALKGIVIRALALAEVLGPALGIKGGLPHEKALRALEAADDIRSVDESLIFKRDAAQSASVLEATAVAAGAIRDTGRRVVVVADIGGGTSDFGAFMTGLPGRSVLAEIDGGSQILHKAGDHLDMLLTRYVLDKLDYVPGDDAVRGVEYDLRRLQREYKEVLFRQGRLGVRVGDDAIDLTVEEFLTFKGVKVLSQQLREKFMRTLEVAVRCAREYPQPFTRRRTKVEILFTGGGHSLPMVRDLANNLPDDWSYRVVDPDFAERRQDDAFNQVRHQLAVAVGGAMRDLPKLAPPVRRLA